MPKRVSISLTAYFPFRADRNVPAIVVIGTLYHLYILKSVISDGVDSGAVVGVDTLSGTLY